MGVNERKREEEVIAGELRLKNFAMFFLTSIFITRRMVKVEG